MIDLTIELDYVVAAGLLQRVRNGLSIRAQLHARMAVMGEAFVRDHVLGLDQHATAQRLGANPTQHLAKTAAAISSVSDDDGGAIRVPRASRLRAAFGDYSIFPGAGKKYLAIPDNARTYGKRPGEISEPLHFKIVGGRFPALCFKDGTVAFWLKKSVKIKQDRTLLPFDELPVLFDRVAVAYVEELKEGGVA